MSDNEHTTVRIVDIARMAGVSVATVDRVIHNRGKVSEENLARINEVLRRVDYRPNLIARSLASGRRYTLCAVMPRFAPGEYWADFEAGIARAEAEAVRYNVTVRRFCFDQYDRSSFESLLETLRREEFDGAVIATLFAEMVEPFTRELDARGVPYVFVDSDIPACNRLAYFGTSSFDAGAVAARLLFDRLDPGADIVVGRIVHRGDAGSNQWRNREAGFRSYLEAHAFRGRLHYAALRLDDEACNGRVLDEMFRENPSIAGAVTFNSTCYILAGYLAARRRDGVRLVGYDVIRRNGEMLAAGGNMGGATIAPDKSFLDLEIEAFRKVVDLNLFGTVLPTTVFGEAMTARRKGVIVNFCSESALRPLTRVVGYGAAKAAIANYTKYMAAELAMKFSPEMRVNAIVPGFLLTNQNRALLTNEDGSYTDRARTIIAHTPAGRFAEPEELLGTIHYLVSDASSFVTGALAVVDGGFDAFSI